MWCDSVKRRIIGYIISAKLADMRCVRIVLRVHFDGGNWGAMRGRSLKGKRGVKGCEGKGETVFKLSMGFAAACSLAYAKNEAIPNSRKSTKA